jgi:hypothetical protein
MMSRSLSQMTEKAKKILITTKTVEVTTIHRSRTIGIRKHCFICGHQVEWLEIASVAKLIAVPLVEVTQLIAPGLLHCWSGPRRQTMVCANSLENLKH